MTTITIPAGPIPNVGPDCSTVLATDDTLVEGPEEFDIMITSTNQPGLVSIGPSATTEVTITDNEGRLSSNDTCSFGSKQ